MGQTMMNSLWTGERLERCVWGSLTIEHLHRYSAVLGLVRRKAVVDIACGEGYGSNLLACAAERVIGIDISRDAVERAKRRYRGENLEFREGRADRLPAEGGSIDVVVSFETIEHHAQHEEMLCEIKRILKPAGTLVMSTPDRDVTSTDEKYANPYHVKELSTAEFRDLIQRHFEFANFYKQGIVVGSLILPEGRMSAFESLGGSFDSATCTPGPKGFLFNICIASNEKPQEIPGSVYDGSDAIVSEATRQAIRSSRYYKLAYPVLRVMKRMEYLKEKLRRR
jgi:SAM-dependent methyltransferase